MQSVQHGSETCVTARSNKCVIGANKIMKHLVTVQCWFYKLIVFGGIIMVLSVAEQCFEKQFVANYRVFRQSI